MFVATCTTELRPASGHDKPGPPPGEGDKVNICAQDSTYAGQYLTGTMKWTRARLKILARLPPWTRARPKTLAKAARWTRVAINKPLPRACLLTVARCSLPFVEPQLPRARCSR